MIYVYYQGQVHNRGIAEIRFLRYKDSKDCGDSCDFFFKPLKIENEDGTVLQTIAKTSSTSNTNDVDLTKVTELINPMQLNIPTNKTVKIVASVWDEDGFFHLADDFVRYINDFRIPFDAISVGNKWITATKNIGTTVTFKVMLIM